MAIILGKNKERIRKCLTRWLLSKYRITHVFFFKSCTRTFILIRKKKWLRRISLSYTPRLSKKYNTTCTHLYSPCNDTKRFHSNRVGNFINTREDTFKWNIAVRVLRRRQLDCSLHDNNLGCTLLLLRNYTFLFLSVLTPYRTSPFGQFAWRGCALCEYRIVPNT